MSNLMYSAQDTLLTAAELAAVPTPQAMGAFHQPVGFGDYLELVKHRLTRAGITVEHEEYVLDPQGSTFFGALQLGIDGFQRDDMNITLGVRGSHTQKTPRAICLGNRVIVCSNMCFNGDLANLSTKQTTNVWRRLPGMVDQAVARIPELAQREGQRADRFKQFELKPRWGDAALVEVFRRDGLTAAQLGRAVTEWHEPKFEEHAEDGFTAWRLLNAVTEANKPTGQQCNMDLVRERTSRAVSFLDEVVGF
jgi:hypothetical protein